LPSSRETAKNRLIVALDYESLPAALRTARRLAGLVGMFKIGKQLFTAEGPRAVKQVARLGAGIFLDLKYHDIPNTVAGAVAAAAKLPGVRLVNLHTLGGREMMRAASSARGSKLHPKLLGVTLLTSLDEYELARVGILGPPLKRVVALAKLARNCGLNGVVASPREASAIRRELGAKFLIVVPGVRPAGAAHGDQSRVATAKHAITAGADYIVVGRPITAAPNPREAAGRILDEIASALR